MAAEQFVPHDGADQWSARCHRNPVSGANRVGAVWGGDHSAHHLAVFEHDPLQRAGRVYLDVSLACLCHEPVGKRRAMEFKRPAQRN